MVKRKRAKANRKSKASRRRAPSSAASAVSIEGDQVSYSTLSLHELFQQQTRTLLDRADLDEEQKQNLLIAMSCPCCGAGGMSLTAKIRRRV